FQAEDGIRDFHVTGVQTCALPIWPDNLVLAIGLGNANYAMGDLPGAENAFRLAAERHASSAAWNNLAVVLDEQGRRSEAVTAARSEERRVGRGQGAGRSRAYGHTA